MHVTCARMHVTLVLSEAGPLCDGVQHEPGAHALADSVACLSVVSLADSVACIGAPIGAP
eukprot:352694-Rhodomonas_salina.2